MTLYVGGGYVCEGATGYEDGDPVVPDYDVYDFEFDMPLPPGAAPPTRRPAGGEKVTRREERTREHPQFAKRYTEDLDLEKLKESLEWLVTRPDTAGAFRWDDIHDKAGEVAGIALWVGFGPDVKPGAIHDGLYEAFKAVGVDISQTLIGSDNLRRGLERDGGLVKQAFFRIFIPEKGWKLLSDWTLLREGETKASVRPELQAMIRERQRSRRLEIIETLKDIRVAELRAAELAKERAAREAAEAEAKRLREELERQDRALAAVARAMAQEKPAPPPARPRTMREAMVQRLGPESAAAVRRAEERLAHPPAPAEVRPATLREAMIRAMGPAAAETARLSRQRGPVVPSEEAVKAQVPAVVERPRKAPTAVPAPARKRPTAAERREGWKAEARRLDARARRLEQRSGRSRTRQANEDRREARELRARATQLKERAKR